MSRTKEAEAHSAVSASANPPGPRKKSSESDVRSSAIAWAIRGAFLVSTGALAFVLQPFGLSSLLAAAVALAIAAAAIVAELLLREQEAARVLGAAAGAVAGIFVALLVTLIIARTAEPEPTKSFLEYASLLAFGYLGLTLGASIAGKLRISEVIRPRTSANELQPAVVMPKLLDTSVLIDGRIADICEAQFLDGPLHVPRFVLHELQLIADSSDALRRQRGRRGLEVLQRIQKLPGLEVLVLEEDGASDADVDRALVELARRRGAKIVTNDFNLNKVASVQGISVLNVNQLANALRPAVLPGEPMRVLILREGKEATQGVAYLEDGTMVVVDGARRFTNRTVDITVTSVHQTPAGKMIFGRMEERAENNPTIARQAAAGRGPTPARGPDSGNGEREPK